MKSNMSLENERKARAKKIEQIEDEIRNLDTSPLYEYRKENGYSIVIGEGNVLADVMIVGEAPGLQEAKKGRPFVGQAGSILDRLLHSIGLERDNVYITNVVKDRPPNNRKPTSKEVALYGPYLSQQIDIIRPSVIVALGQTAMEYLFKKYNLPERDQKLGQLHGNLFEVQTSYGKIHMMPTYHPAATFYNDDVKNKLEADIQVLKQLI
jgi:DNA polymerase